MKKVIGIIVGIIVLVGAFEVGYFLVTSDAFDKVNDPKKVTTTKKKEEEKVVDNNYYLYIDFDYQKKIGKIYQVNDDFSTNEVDSNITVGNSEYYVLGNMLYYIDTNKDVIKYDLVKKQATKLNFNVSKIKAIYEMRVSNKYVVCMGGDDYIYFYDMINNTEDKVKLNINNVSYLINDETDEVYYITKKHELLVYNFVTKEKSKFGMDIRPLLIKDNLMYCSNLDNNKFFTYDLKDNNRYAEISKGEYMLALYGTEETYVNTERDLKKVTKGKEEVVLRVDELPDMDGIYRIANTKNHVIIDCYWGMFESKFFIYDKKTGKVEEVKEEDFTKLYYMVDSLYLSDTI